MMTRYSFEVNLKVVFCAIASKASVDRKQLTYLLKKKKYYFLIVNNFF